MEGNISPKLNEEIPKLLNKTIQSRNDSRSIVDKYDLRAIVYQYFCDVQVCHVASL